MLFSSSFCNNNCLCSCKLSGLAWPTLTTSLQQKNGMQSAALQPDQPPASPEFLQNLILYNFVGLPSLSLFYIRYSYPTNFIKTRAGGWCCYPWNLINFSSDSLISKVGLVCPEQCPYYTK